MITVKPRLRVMAGSAKMALYALVSSSTGQKETRPLRIADLELREVAATFTKGSRQVRLMIRMMIDRTICGPVQIFGFLTSYTTVFCSS